MHRAVFIAPKVYAYTTLDENANEKLNIKIKGLSQKRIRQSIDSYDLTFDKMFELLAPEQFLEFTQEKWFKHLNEGIVETKEALYQLRMTTNKRKPIYKQIKGYRTHLYSDTEPYHYDELAKDYQNKNIVQNEVCLRDDLAQKLTPLKDKLDILENNNKDS